MKTKDQQQQYRVGDVVKLRGLQPTSMKYVVVSGADNYYITIKEIALCSSIQLISRSDIVRA